MHTPIAQLRRNLLQNRADFLKSAAFQGEYLALVVSLERFLSSLSSHHQAVAFCWPYKDEPDLRKPLLDWLHSAPNRKLLLPKIRPDHQLDFYTWSESDPLILNSFGIAEPNPLYPGVLPIKPDCILIPCVGWSVVNNRFWRLGYGGGYFDRTIASLKKEGQPFKAIGIGFDWQKLNGDDWAPQNHDQPLDFLITNSGAYSS